MIDDIDKIIQSIEDIEEKNKLRDWRDDVINGMYDIRKEVLGELVVAVFGE